MNIDCSPVIDTKNSTEIFTKLGVNCTTKNAIPQWRNSYDPAAHMHDNTCNGYVGVPDVVSCKSNVILKPGVRRLCRCQDKGQLVDVIFCFVDYCNRFLRFLIKL